MHREKINDLLIIDESDSSVSSRENSHLEYKESFGYLSFDKYAKTMASFANAGGGYIIYGISDSPRFLVGLNSNRFEQLDPRKLTQFLNSYFSPELEWTAGSFEILGKEIAFLHTAQAVNKPVICTSNSGNNLKEGDIYYRYRGQSLSIKYPELRAIIDDRLEKERKAWLQHIEKIAEAGPTNIGVLDMLEGKLFGAGRPYLISEDLINKLKFIREGSFDETGGEPTLTVIGDVKSAGPMLPMKEIPVGIHFDEIIKKFLGSRSMQAHVGEAFLEECFRQNTHYLPIYYYKHTAEISTEEALNKLEESPNNDLIKGRMKNRLTGKKSVPSVGVINDSLPLPTEGEFLTEYQNANTQKKKRSLIVALINNDFQHFNDIYTDLDLDRVIEAITNLKSKIFTQFQNELRGILFDIYENNFSEFESSAKTTFRKAVALLDEALNKK